MLYEISPEGAVPAPTRVERVAAQSFKDFLGRALSKYVVYTYIYIHIYRTYIYIHIHKTQTNIKKTIVLRF